MAYSLPNGSTFDVAATYGAPVSVTSISNANPAVATSVGHSLEVGDVVLLTSAWTRLTNRAFRVSAVAADTFTLQGVDTTSTRVYPVGGSAGSAAPVETWVQVPQIMSVDSSGGDQNFYTFQFLEDDDERQFPTNKSAMTITMEVADDPDQAYVPILEGYDEAKTTNVSRLNLVNGDTIMYPAVISITSTPALTVNELMTRTITLAMQGRPSRV